MELIKRDDAIGALDLCSNTASVLNLMDLPAVDAIPLPDNATNGDIIKTLFPRTRCVEKNGIIETGIDEGTLFNLDWWNAPYRRSRQNK